ncbi:MAG: polysaccharide deacetylase family protein, partial [bacterium]
MALTFDACSSPGRDRCDREVVDWLIRTRTPATLFLGGKWMEEQPAVVRRLAEQPFLELGTHGYMHERPAALTDGLLRADLEHALAVHEALTGCRPALFRAPYAARDDRVTRIAASLGLTTVEYDVDSGDPDPAFDAERLERWVGRQTRNGSIIVMHMNGRGWHTA